MLEQSFSFIIKVTGMIVRYFNPAKRDRRVTMTSMIHFSDEEIENLVDEMRKIDRQRYGFLYVTNDDIFDDKGNLVNVEDFYSTIKEKMKEIIHQARKEGELTNLIKLDGALIYLIAILRGEHTMGEVFSIDRLKSELEEVLNDEMFAYDMYMEYDEMVSPLGLSQIYSYSKTRAQMVYLEKKTVEG